MASLFDDHSRRKLFIQNFSHTLPKISLDLAPLQGSKITQLLQRLFISSTKQSGNGVQFGARRKEEILSFLDLLLNPAFRDGKIRKLGGESLLDHSSFSRYNKNKMVSVILGAISTKVLYPSISALVLSNYIRRQMSAPQKLKDLDFRINLKTGISMLALFLFKRLPLGSSIRGLRIVCSGR